MVDYKYENLLLKPHINKQLKIAADDRLFTATNSDIKWENFKLTESLCSDFELRFGTCEASMVEFQILNAFIPLAGKWLTITETLEGKTDTPFQYGRYKVFSDVPTADKEYRDIVAYDAMYDILNADVTEWYNTILPNKDSAKTLKQFRENFIQHFGLNEITPEDGLVNDGMVVERTVEPEELSGKDVITAICEINGCFGHIGRDGKFHYIYLPQNIQGLYPADFLFPDHVPERYDYLPQAETGHLYPQTPKSTKIGSNAYIKCQYEDYHVRQINKLQIRQEENDIGTILPKTEPSEKDNSYIIEDNFLVYGKSAAELDIIAENIFKKITAIVYRPFNMDCVGNPCIEVGDTIRTMTKYAIVESYVLSRTLKGIQGKRDSYSAKGSERRQQQVNSVKKSIIQLKGKANILTRTVEENKLEMYDIQEGLENNISVTAAGLQANITAEKNRAEGEETKLSNSISVTASGLDAKINSEITRASNEEERLSNNISITAEGLSAEITRSKDAESALSTRISANAEGITTKVSKGNISSEISQESEKVSIKSNRLIIESSQFKLDGNGNATFGGTLSGANGNFSGKVTATSGTFDNVTIHDNCTVAGKSITGTIGNNVGWNGDTINGGYIGSGLNGNYITSGTVSNDRITNALSGKTFTNTTGDEDEVIILNGSSENISSRLSPYSISFGPSHNAVSLGYGGLYFHTFGPPTTWLTHEGNFVAAGTKSRLAKTENYGNRLLYCYETPSPMFGDIGEGRLDDDGTCVIYIDDAFSETIDTKVQYQVFLQAYGEGNVYIRKRTPSYFVVKGPPNLHFGWEMKAVQMGYDSMRMEEQEYKTDNKNYAEETYIYLETLLYDIEKESEEIL